MFARFSKEFARVRVTHLLLKTLPTPPKVSEIHAKRNPHIQSQDQDQDQDGTNITERGYTG